MNKDNDFKNIFETYSVTRALFVMALPTIAGQLITLIYNMADTFFIGKTNNPYMVAGCSLILPLFNMTIPLCNLLSIGGGTLISSLLGKNEIAEAKKVSSFSIFFTIVLSLFFSLSIYFNVDRLLVFLGASENVFSYAKTYIIIVLCIGTLPIVLQNVLAGLFRSVGHSKISGFGIILGGVLNIILDAIFMFVIFKNGREVYGISYATLISNVVALIYFVICLFLVDKNNKIIVFDIKSIFIEKSRILKIFSVGISSAITPFLFDVDYIVLDKLMSHYGEIPLAALGIVLKVMRLPLNTCMGLCLGMIPILAYNSAKHNYKRLIETAKKALLFGTVFSILSIMMYEILAKEFIYIFIHNEETVSYGVRFLRAQSPSSLVMFLCFFVVYYFQGRGNGAMASFLGIFRWLAINIPMLFILDRLYGYMGLAYCQLVADIIMATISLILFMIEIRKLDRLNNNLS